VGGDPDGLNTPSAGHTVDEKNRTTCGLTSLGLDTRRGGETEERILLVTANCPETTGT